MPTRIPELDAAQRTEREKVEDWRELELLRAGYPPDDAIDLSRLPHVDLHQAVELLANGCAVATAIEILT
jgi:hypothetical protein